MTETRDPAKVTMKNAILAKCHNCMAYYVDGLLDCENPRCPLYTWMPYRKREPNLLWTEFHPKKKGLVKFSSIPKKQLSEERKAKLAAKLAEIRAKKEQPDTPRRIYQCTWCNHYWKQGPCISDRYDADCPAGYTDVKWEEKP
jgi:hypothetical protein